MVILNGSLMGYARITWLYVQDISSQAGELRNTFDSLFDPRGLRIRQL